MKMKMNLEIKPLTSALADDYFEFFENRAFTDDSPYRCYCQLFQMTKEEHKAAFEHIDGADAGRAARKVAEQQIHAGVLRGYLAFSDGLAIGWCNVNAKANFPVESCTGARFYEPVEKREKAVVCFEIAPEFRGKGVATALLQRAAADAKLEGYTAIDGYPRLLDERDEWDYTGPVRLYEKAGFIKVSQQGDSLVMRKDLTK